jgi:hypothetical protein
MTYYLPPWAWALNAAFNVALGVGLVLLLRAVVERLGWRRPRRRPVDPRRLWALGLALTGAGVLGHSVGSRWFTVARPLDTSAPVSLDSSHFDSRMPPALAVRAPPGWSVEYLAKNDQIIVTGPGALLVLTSTLTEEEVTPDFISRELAPFEEAGATVNRLSPEGVSRLEAARFLVKDPSGPGDVCLWIVKRGRRFFTTAMCSGRDADCWTACNPVLDSLAWRVPAGVAPEDL